MASRPEITHSPVNWAFILHDENQWIWRQLRIDGSIELHSSSQFPGFGVAVVDAIKHGFSPKEQHWVMTNKTGTTHFHPGNKPIFIPPDFRSVRARARGKASAPTKPEMQHEN